MKKQIVFLLIIFLALTTGTSSPTTATTLYGSALNFDVSNVLEKIWGPGSNGIIVGGGLNLSTKPGFGWSQQYGGMFVTSYSIQGVQSRYLTQTNSVNVTVTGPAGSVIEVWDLESLTVIATNISIPGSPIIFMAQPNRRYGGFAWYTDNSQKDIAIFAAYSTSPPMPTPATTSSLTISSISISAIETTGSTAKATFTWITNIPADSAVEYKESGAVGWTIWGGNGSTVTNHSETISLKTATVYSYIIRSIASGVVTRSAEQILTTPAAIITPTSTSDTAPPTVTFGDITLQSAVNSFNSVIINYVVKDNIGIVASNSKIDDKILGSFASLSTSNTVYNASYATTLSNGFHTITVFARDAAGNSIIKNLDFSLPLTATISAVNTTPPSLPSPLPLPLPAPLLPLPSLLTQTPTTPTQSLILELQQQIKSLQEQVQKLQAEVSSTKTELEAVKTGLKFTGILRRGVSGDEVKQLQTFLKQQYPDFYQGLVTGYFGPLTEAAVKKFQAKQGIDTIGIVGPKTLSKLNELVTEGAGASGVIPPGLLTAPGIQGNIGTTTPTTTPTLPVATVPIASTTTTTPSGTIPATPATPATPTSVSGTPTTPATPATPAQPATTTSTTTPKDTTPPVISNILVTNITETTTVITWITNESASTEVKYSLTSPAGATTTITGTGGVISHGINLTGLASASTYYYVVISRDNSGNIATSNEQTFITLTPAPIALASPQGYRTDWATGAALKDMYYEVVEFKYDSSAISQVKSFRLYSKRPGETNFTLLSTFSNVGTFASSCSGNIRGSGTELWALLCYGNGASWTIQTTSDVFTQVNGYNINVLKSASNFPLGEYDYYVTAVDANGIESQPSKTMKKINLESTKILSPIGQTPSGFKIQWTYASGWSQGLIPHFYILIDDASNYSIVYQENVYSSSYTLDSGSTQAFKIYSGPALDPAKQYRIQISGVVVDSSQIIYGSLAEQRQIFSVSAATTTSSLGPRSKNLAAISQMINSLNEILKQLLQLMK